MSFSVFDFLRRDLEDMSVDPVGHVFSNEREFRDVICQQSETEATDTVGDSSSSSTSSEDPAAEKKTSSSSTLDFWFFVKSAVQSLIFRGETWSASFTKSSGNDIPQCSVKQLQDQMKSDFSKLLEEHGEGVSDEKDVLYENVILSGGGLNGLILLGGLCYFDRDDKLKNIRRFCGISVGFIICLCLSLNMSPLQIASWLLTHNVYVFNNFQDMIQNWALLKIEEILNKLKQCVIETTGIDLSIHTLDSLHKLTGKELNAVSFELAVYKIVVFNYKNSPNLKVLDCVKMACAIPFAFEKCIINDRLFIDAGLIVNFPLQAQWMLDFFEQNTLAIGLKSIDMLQIYISQLVKQRQFCKHQHSRRDHSLPSETGNCTLSDTPDDVKNTNVRDDVPHVREVHDVNSFDTWSRCFPYSENCSNDCFACTENSKVNSHSDFIFSDKWKNMREDFTENESRSPGTSSSAGATTSEKNKAPIFANNPDEPQKTEFLENQTAIVQFLKQFATLDFQKTLQFFSFVFTMAKVPWTYFEMLNYNLLNKFRDKLEETRKRQENNDESRHQKPIPHLTLVYLNWRLNRTSEGTFFESLKKNQDDKRKLVIQGFSETMSKMRRRRQ